MEIKTATREDLPRLHDCATEFYASSQILKRFDIERFVKTWEWLIGTKMGVIFFVEKDGKITGTIGGIVRQDLYSSDLLAEEAFWFVPEEHRGHGIALYRAFEKWSRSRGANELHMMHLLDLMPEKVSDFYMRQGYRPIETRYSKVLVGT